MREIKLTQNQTAIVDDEDFEWLNQFNWFADRNGNVFYAARRICVKGKKTTLSMHILSVTLPRLRLIALKTLLGIIEIGE